MDEQDLYSLISVNFGGVAVVIDSSMKTYSTIMSALLTIFAQAGSFDVYVVDHKLAPTEQASDGYYYHLKAEEDVKSVVDVLHTRVEAPFDATIKRILERHKERYEQAPDLKPLHLIVFADADTTSMDLEAVVNIASYQAFGETASRSVGCFVALINDTLTAPVVVRALANVTERLIEHRRSRYGLDPCSRQSC